MVKKIMSSAKHSVLFSAIGFSVLSLLFTPGISSAQSSGAQNSMTPESSAKKASDDSMGAIKTAKVQIVSPKDGETVKPTFTAKFMVEGLKVAKAGQIEPGTGHFHILVDTPATPEGEVVPADDKHLHYGQGQTEANLSLKPGPHTLTLQFADGAHRAYSKMLTQTIKIIVK